MSSPTNVAEMPKRVAIVGGGIAGLYTALLLKQKGIDFHIFEGTNRVGGRVKTHFFDSIHKDQYFEAGAMRIPDVQFQTITWELVDYVNDRQKWLPPDERVPIQRIHYKITADNNFVYINSKLRPNKVTAESVGWKLDTILERIWGTIPANDIMQATIGKFIDVLKAADTLEKFEVAFREIIDKWDDYSFRHFLKTDRASVHPVVFRSNQLEVPPSLPQINPNIPFLKDTDPLPDTIIDFLETVTSQTNQFTLSVPELVMQNLDFGETRWWSIEDGMSRLPEAMARLVGPQNITFGARVTSIGEASDGVFVQAKGYNGELTDKFDAVVLAIPPAALKMLVSRPQWSTPKEMAIRSTHFEPLYKMGLRFKARFWELPQGDVNAQILPSRGGQSTTDLSIRWIVYPSYGLGTKGPGVLLLYAWMTDAATWVPLSPIERRSLALDNLKKIYGETVQAYFDGKVQYVPLDELLIESADAVWSEATATGDAMFLPGQFRTLFDAAREPEAIVEGDRPRVYFAGEHLSFHHTWIAGAADSALWTTRKLLNDQNIQRLHLNTQDNSSGLAPATLKKQSVTFRYKPADPLGLARGDAGGAGSRIPLSLGHGDAHAMGVQMNSLQGMYASPYSRVTDRKLSEDRYFSLNLP